MTFSLEIQPVHNLPNLLTIVGAPDIKEDILQNRLLTQASKLEDIAFYEDQRSDRKMTLSETDSVYKKKITKKRLREASEEDKTKQKSENQYKKCRNLAYDSQIDTPINLDDPLFSPAAPITPQLRSSQVPLLCPKNIMDGEEIWAVADRLRMTENEVVAMVAAVLKTCNADLSDFNLSRSTAQRRRKYIREKICKKVISDFISNLPSNVVVHWDGKMVKNVMGSTHEDMFERIAALISDAQQFPEGKLLGVPTIGSATGRNQMRAIKEALDAW